MLNKKEYLAAVFESERLLELALPDDAKANKRLAFLMRQLEEYEAIHDPVPMLPFYALLEHIKKCHPHLSERERAVKADQLIVMRSCN